MDSDRPGILLWASWQVEALPPSFHARMTCPSFVSLSFRINCNQPGGERVNQKDLIGFAWRLS